MIRDDFSADPSRSLLQILMGAVAERLGGTLATGAPVVGLAGLDLNGDGWIWVHDAGVSSSELPKETEHIFS